MKRLRHNVMSCRSTDKCTQMNKESRNISMKRALSRFVFNAVGPIALLVLIVAAWQFVTIAFEIEALILPKPMRVFEAGMHEFGQIAGATWNTAAAALCGFGLSLLTGTLIASVFTQSRMIRGSCYPYAIFLQTVPVVAIAPIIIMWFGYGFQSVVVVSFIISLFPLVTNATSGMLAVDTDLLDLFHLHRASRWQVLVKLRLPNSVPHIITGAKTSSGLAVIGAIVGEFFAGDNTSGIGLGYLIRLKSELMKTDGLFASVIASTLLGVAIFGTLSATGAAVLSRWYDLPAEKGH